MALAHLRVHPAPPPAEAVRQVPVESVDTTRMVIRRVGPLSVLRLAFLFWLWVGVMILLAVTAAWVGVTATGSVDRFEEFVRDLGFNDFRVHDGALWRVTLSLTVLFVLVATAASWLMAVAFNLLAGLVGGIRIVVATAPDRRRSVPRATAGTGRAGADRVGTNGADGTNGHRRQETWTTG
jgi:hypothetical protein